MERIKGGTEQFVAFRAGTGQRKITAIIADGNTILRSVPLDVAKSLPPSSSRTRKGRVNGHYDSKCQPLRRKIAQLFESGHALTTQDFAEIFEESGASPSTGRGLSMELKLGYFAGETGVEVKSERYKQRTIYYHADLPREDTDIEEVKTRIAKEKEAISKARKK